tara:strand:- start:5344 stop:5775 length:432 start_codon:yes stop_codon:yes gene_type:complete
MSALSNNFDDIIQELTNYRVGITQIIYNVRQLEKKYNKEIKKNQTLTEKKNIKKPSGFATPTKISKELCDFMKKTDGELAARTEVTQYIIKYIKEKKLQNQENKQEIILDGNLSKLLNCGTETITYFTIQKYMNQHFIQSNSI